METASGHRGTCAESTNARAIVGPITLENVVRVVTVTCLKRVLGVSRNAFAEAQGICRPVVPSRKLSGAPLRPGRFTHPSSWVGFNACPYAPSIPQDRPSKLRVVARAETVLDGRVFPSFREFRIGCRILSDRRTCTRSCYLRSRPAPRKGEIAALEWGNVLV